MRKIYSLLIAYFFIVVGITSCSSDDDSSNGVDEIEYRITIDGVLDGDFTNYPGGTDNTFIATFIKDEAFEPISYTESLTNEMVIQKIKTVTAANKVGVKLNIDQTETIMYYINIKIEEVSSGTVVYNHQMSKTLVSGTPDSYSTLEIKVEHDISTNTTTLVE